MQAYYKLGHCQRETPISRSLGARLGGTPERGRRRCPASAQEAAGPHVGPATGSLKAAPRQINSSITLR